jgi:O-6-methylguanine DNA methyltransferase
VAVKGILSGVNAHHRKPRRESFVGGAEFDAAFRIAAARLADGTQESPSPETVVIDWVESPVGPLLIGATHEAVCLLEFSEIDSIEARLNALRRRVSQSVIVGTNRWLSALRTQLAEYFARTRREFALPLFYGGSEFQHRVWSLLREIPYGETWSYGDLALKTGDASASRAVGATNGMNPIAIVIPCHRVIYANGDLGGFGGGLWRKEILLDLEKGQSRLDL